MNKFLLDAAKAQSPRAPTGFHFPQNTGFSAAVNRLRLALLYFCVGTSFITFSLDLYHVFLTLAL